jgi:hypothetical protein
MKAAFTPGSTFAGYRVEALVDRGGMGVVYQARDLNLERRVALKWLCRSWPRTSASARAFCASRGWRRRFTTPA